MKFSAMIFIGNKRRIAAAIRLAFLLAPVWLITGECASAQTISSYNFFQLTSAFNTVNGTTGVTTDFTSGDDAVTSAVTIPFSFTYNAIAYTSCKISTNGFITLGSATTPGSTAYTPVSNTSAAYNTAISALGCDLVATVQHNTIGTAPNRIFVIEWSNAYRYIIGSGENLNFQVKLYETTNVIEVDYGSVSTTNSVFSTGSCETGIKGGSTDYNNVSFTNANLTGYAYTNNWNSLITPSTQSDVAGITSTVYPAAGTTLRWTPSACIQPVVSATASGVTNTSATVSWTNSAAYSSGYYVRWRKVDDPYNFPTWSNPVAISAGSSSYTITGLVGSSYYIFSVEGRCSAGSRSNHSAVTTTNTTNGRGLFLTSGCSSVAALLTVGPTAAYPTLTAALAVLNSCPITQPTVVELQSNYNPLAETFPLLITGNPGASATNTITIRPAAGAGPFTISGSSSKGLLLLQGAKYYRIDGRSGGTGSTINLTFYCTANDEALALVHDAQYNIIRYVGFKAADYVLGSGVIGIFGTYNTGSSAGTSYNTITNCDIDGLGASNACIYAQSSPSPADNKQNIISNNLIHDYFSDNLITTNAGIYISSDNATSLNSQWTISGNHIYQTSAKLYNYNYGKWAGIMTNGNGAFNILDNYIGGTAPYCGGSPMNITQSELATPGPGQYAGGFYCLLAIVSDNMNTVIRGNVIRNMNMSTSSIYGFAGIALGKGSAEIDGNTVGSITSNSIQMVALGTSAGDFTAFSAGNAFGSTGDHVYIHDNIAAGITVEASGQSLADGIYISSTAVYNAPNIIANNKIGSLNAPIINNSQGYTRGIVQFNDIGAFVTGNTITNLRCTSLTGAAAVEGISTYAGDNKIGSIGQGNIISNLSSDLPMAGTRISGIHCSASGSEGNLIEYNQIFGLTNTSAAATTVCGINAYCGTGTNQINNNKLYGFGVGNATAAGSTLNGLFVSNGTASIYNNLVSLGTVNPTVPLTINGIYETGVDCKIYYNSVYIGGNNITGGTSDTYAFRSTSGTHTVKNNIFSNVRSNGTATGKNYAFRVAIVSAASILNNNDYYAPGSGGFLGTYSTADYSTMAQVRVGTGQDAKSVSADPKFNNPAAATPDLTINTTTPSVLESTAVAVTGITQDYAGVTRNVYTPDIGAYEINATPGYPVIGNISAPGAACAASSHIILVTITSGVATLSSGMVTLNYSFDGIAQAPLNMTYYGGNLWGATIPAATPANALVKFNVSVNDGNYIISKDGITYNDAPALTQTITATATPSVICRGSSSVLKVDASGPGTIALGTGASTLGTATASEALSPLSEYYESQHTQYLVLGSDLFAAGLRAGNLTSLSFNVTTKNSTKPYTNYNIKLAATALASLSNGNNAATFYSVYKSSATPGSGYTSSYGTNTFPFGSGTGTASAFPWDGASNILIDICFENDPLGGGTYYSNVDVVSATVKGYTATYGYYRDNASLCGMTDANTSSSTKLPDFSFYGSNSVLTPSAYSWSDGSTTVGTTNNLSVSPIGTTNYTATVTLNGCPATSNVAAVTVNTESISSQPAAVAKCAGSNTSFTVAAAGGATTYQWQVSTDNGLSWNNLANGALYSGVGSTTLSLTGISTGLNNYRYRAMVSGCGPAVYSDGAAKLTVNTPPVIGISSSAPAICAGSATSVTLTASGAATYIWSPASTLSASSGTSVSASPLTSTTYSVTGTDANTCTGTANYLVTVLQSPRISAVTATPTIVCAGNSATLAVAAVAPDISALPNAYVFAQTSTTYTPIAGTTLPNGAGDDAGNGNLPIGFNFYYNNIAHTIFSAGSNGLLVLSDATPAYNSGYPYSNALASTPLVIAPFWDDNNTTGGSIQYLTTGTAPNRVLTVQWTGMHTGGNGSATSATMSCQAQLFEGTGVIRFIYGAPSTLFNFVTASIGISGGAGNFLSVTPGSPATASNASENSSVTAAVPAGTVYTFTPPAVSLSYAWSPVSGLSPNANSATVTTPALNVPANYNISVANGACSSSGSVLVLVRAANTWIGVNSNWFDLQNWCPGLPSPSSDVTIPAGAANYPVISSLAAGYATVRNITIQAGASVTVNGSGRFSVSGAITNGGTFDLSDGSLVLSGASQNILPNSISGSIVKNLFLNAASTATNYIDNSGGQLKIKDSLSFLTSNNTLQVNSSIVLMSGAAKTASLTDITANGSLSGNYVNGDVVVERFLKAGRKWRFLSVPTGTQQTVKNAWMENNSPAGNTGAAGYGTWITDPSGTANGFDAASVSASMKKWNGTGYTGISAVNSTMITLRGYMIYVRGDRSIPNTGSSTSVTTLRTAGQLYQGDYPAGGFSIPAGGGLTDIGNIYASAVDLSRMNWGVSNATPIQVLVWDPFLGTGSAYGLGAFQTLTRVAGQNDFVITPGGGSYAGVNSGDVMNKIESGQAFFVQGGSLANTLQFKETAKGLGSHLVSFIGNAPQNLFGRLYLQTAGTHDLTDGFGVMTSQNQSNAHTDDDAIKQVNTGENISVRQGTALHAVDMRGLLNENDTIFINMANMHVNDYSWEIDSRNLDQPGREGFLVDKLSGIYTALNLAGVTPYSFSITNDANSYAADRFMIVFKTESVLSIPTGGGPVILQPDLSLPRITISPNPAENKIVRLQFVKMPRGEYQIIIHDAQDRIVGDRTVQINSARQSEAIDLSASAAGTYFVEVRKGDRVMLRDKAVVL